MTIGSGNFTVKGISILILRRNPLLKDGRRLNISFLRYPLQAAHQLIPIHVAIIADHCDRRDWIPLTRPLRTESHHPQPETWGRKIARSLYQHFSQLDLQHRGSRTSQANLNAF
jgi:hypothetical protein